jgi:2,3-dihydroxybenzoate decarboxylase
MLQRPKCPVIAIEEHYYDTELVNHFGRVEPNAAVVDRMFEIGEKRLKEMDEAGIDIQVLSHGAPSAQKLNGDGALALTQGDGRGRHRHSGALARRALGAEA